MKEYFLLEGGVSGTVVFEIPNHAAGEVNCHYGGREKEGDALPETA